MKEIGEWDAYEFKTISEHPGVTREELLKIETELINHHLPAYNTQKNTIRTKDVYNQYYRDRYEKQKDVINKKASQRYACKCGADVRSGEKARHFKSLKHVNASLSSSLPLKPASEL